LIRYIKNTRLKTEIHSAEQLDDLVLQFLNDTENGTKFRFLQGKHMLDENEKNTG